MSAGAVPARSKAMYLVEITGVGKSDDSTVRRAPTPPDADVADHFGTLEGTVTKCSMDEVMIPPAEGKTGVDKGPFSENDLPE